MIYEKENHLRTDRDIDINILTCHKEARPFCTQLQVIHNHTRWIRAVLEWGSKTSPIKTKNEKKYHKTNKVESCSCSCRAHNAHQSLMVKIWNLTKQKCKSEPFYNDIDMCLVTGNNHIDVLCVWWNCLRGNSGQPQLFTTYTWPSWKIAKPTHQCMCSLWKVPGRIEGNFLWGKTFLNQNAPVTLALILKGKWKSA